MNERLYWLRPGEIKRKDSSQKLSIPYITALSNRGKKSQESEFGLDVGVGK